MRMNIPSCSIHEWRGWAVPKDQLPNRDHRERRHHSQVCSSPWTTLCGGVARHLKTDGLSSPVPSITDHFYPAGGEPPREWLCSSRQHTELATDAVFSYDMGDGKTEHCCRPDCFGDRGRAVAMNDRGIEEVILMKTRHRAGEDGVYAAAVYPSPPNAVNARVMHFRVAFSILGERHCKTNRSNSASSKFRRDCLPALRFHHSGPAKVQAAKLLPLHPAEYFVLRTILLDLDRVYRLTVFQKQPIIWDGGSNVGTPR